MAARLLNSRLSCLRYVIDNRQLCTWLRSAVAHSECRHNRPSVCRQYSSCATQRQNFSTSPKSLSFDPENVSLQANDNKLAKDISGCLSTQQMLDTVQEHGTIPPEQLLFVCNSLEDIRYKELCRELPWLQEGRVAHLQLRMCYGIENKTAMIRNHPTAILLENCLVGNINNFTNRQLGNIATSMSFLGYTDVSPIYKQLCNRLLSQIEHMTLKDLQAAAFTGRIRSFNESSGRGEKTFTDAMKQRISQWVIQNPLRTEDEVVDFMSTMLYMYKEHEFIDWCRICEPQINTILQALEGINSVENYSAISRFLSILVFRQNLIQHNHLLDVYGKYVMRNMKSLQIRHLRLTRMVCKRTSNGFQQQMDLHEQTVKLFNRHKHNLRAIDFPALRFGFSYDHNVEDNEWRYEYEDLYRNVNFEGIDVFALQLVGMDFHKVQNKELIEKFQRALADNAREVCKFGSVFRTIAHTLAKQPIEDEETLRRFISGVVEETSKSPMTVSRSLLLARFLLPNINLGMSGELMDYLIENVHRLSAYNLTSIANALRNIPKPIASEEAKLEQLQTVLSEACSRKLMEEEPSINYTNFYMSMTLNDRTFADRIVSVLKDFCKQGRTASNDSTNAGLTTHQAAKICRLLINMTHYDEELMDLLVDHSLQDKTEYLFHMDVLSLLKRVGYIPKRKEEFLERSIETYRKLVESGWMPLGIMSSLVILGYMPKKVLREIFTVEFMTKLDNYVERNPYRRTMIGDTVFSINRQVTLECPEMKIPLFCKPERAIATRKYLEMDFPGIRETLLHVVGGDLSNLRLNSVTPYQLRIDYELLMDASGKFVSVELSEQEDHQNYQKVAVMLLSKGSYCTNVKRIIGRCMSEHRLLEISGYKVVKIPHFEWNSMALKGKVLKQRYLRAKISGTQKEGKKEQLMFNKYLKTR